MAHLEELIEQVPSPKRARFSTLLFYIETELTVLICLKFFQLDPNGIEFTEENDPEYETAIGRMRHAVTTFAVPMIRVLRDVSEEADLAYRNLR
jgi:hypothetical protein